MALHPDWTLTEDRSLRGLVVEHAAPDQLVLSRRDRLYLRAATGGPVSPLARIPAPRWRSLAARLPALPRLLRFATYVCRPMPDGTWLAVFDKDIFRIGRIGAGAAERIDRIEGRRSRCRVLRGALAVDADGAAWFGDYLRNAERGPVHVYRLPPGATRAEIAYTFPAGAVRHVHGVYADPADGSLWCTTGDRDGECRIVRSSDGFATVEQIGAGDETWRAVCLAFRGDAVYYGTDAEFRTNAIYRIDRQSGRRDRLGEADGPVWYGARLADWLIFGSTAEECPSNTSGQAALWGVGPSDELVRIQGFDKDRLSTRPRPIAGKTLPLSSLFQFGRLLFPEIEGPHDDLLVTGQGLTGLDGRTFRLRRREG